MRPSLWEAPYFNSASFGCFSSTMTCSTGKSSLFIKYWVLNQENLGQTLSLSLSQNVYLPLFRCRAVDRKDYQMINMDTDSSYMALSDDLVRCVIPDRRSEFLRDYGMWFVEPFCPVHKQSFVDFHQTNVDGASWQQQQCCKTHQLWDSRTPGKFKLEFTGETILALNAKTYICTKDSSETEKLFPYPQSVSPSTKARIDTERMQNSSKVSSKGLSKRTNKLKENDFRSVLTTTNPIRGVNTGFVRKNNVTYTYRQNKRGLTYFYGKRKVMPDGVSTTHLDL